MRWRNTSTPTYAGSAGSNGKPAVVERLEAVDESGNVVAAVIKAVDGSYSFELGGNAISAPKVYRALLSQSGTDAPVATVLENTLGGEVVWTRETGGLYAGTLVDALPVAKTVVRVGYSNLGPGSHPLPITAYVEDPSVVWVLVDSADDAGYDSTLVYCPVEILVYN